MLRRSIRPDFTRRPEIYYQVSLMRSLIKTKSSVEERDLNLPVKKCIYGQLGVLEVAGFQRAFRVLLGTMLSNAERLSAYLLSVLEQCLLFMVKCTGHLRIFFHPSTTPTDLRVCFL